MVLAGTPPPDHPPPPPPESAFSTMKSYSSERTGMDGGATHTSSIYAKVLSDIRGRTPTYDSPKVGPRERGQLPTAAQRFGYGSPKTEKGEYAGYSASNFGSPDAARKEYYGSLSNYGTPPNERRSPSPTPQAPEPMPRVDVSGITGYKTEPQNPTLESEVAADEPDVVLYSFSKKTDPLAPVPGARQRFDQAQKALEKKVQVSRAAIEQEKKNMEKYGIGKSPPPEPKKVTATTTTTTTEKVYSTSSSATPLIRDPFGSTDWNKVAAEAEAIGSKSPPVFVRRAQPATPASSPAPTPVNSPTGYHYQSPLAASISAPLASFTTALSTQMHSGISQKIPSFTSTALSKASVGLPSSLHNYGASKLASVSPLPRRRSPSPTPPVPANPPPSQPPSRIGGSPFSSAFSSPLPAPRSIGGLPAITPLNKRGVNLIYAKDRVGQFEALNTTDRRAQDGNGYGGDKFDAYPVYNPIEDYQFDAGKTFNKGTHPVDSNRQNIAFVGRPSSGKSALINALRGLQMGDPQAAGADSARVMEPFRFLQEHLQHLVLWEVPYPRAVSQMTDLYDRDMSMEKLYESHKLSLFSHIFVCVPDGAPRDEDVSFTRVVHARRTKITILSTKTDDDLDCESRESGRPVNDMLKRGYEDKARRVFSLSMQQQRAQILQQLDVCFVSSGTVRNLLSGTTGYLHYQMDDEKLLRTVGLKLNCHYELAQYLRRQKDDNSSIYRAQFDHALDNIYEKKDHAFARALSPSMKVHPPASVLQNSAIHKSTILADAGFEIMFGVDDRVFGQEQPKCGVRRAGKTAFNYGFIGSSGAGKSAMINAMRGMSGRHPLAAGRSRTKPGDCTRYEFDDDLLKYSVTLWELHYPKKVNAYFEFIDRHNLSNFTALFILINGKPSDADLTFAKIAHRRAATVIFLHSKSDKQLASISRGDEIPLCDLLKQRYIDKGVARFDHYLAQQAPELCGRVHVFFVSAPVFRALRIGDRRGMQYLLHERAVFDFLKQKRIIADLLDSPDALKEGLYANVNLDTAGVATEDIQQ